MQESNHPGRGPRHAVRAGHKLKRRYAAGLAAAVLAGGLAAGVLSASSPALAATGPVQTVLPLGNLDGAAGVAVDSAGDVFATNPSADVGQPQVLELPAGSSSAQVLPFDNLYVPWTVAVDGAGDVFVAEPFSLNGSGNEVVELPAGSSSEQSLPFTGLNSPFGVAADSAGDVFVANTGGNDVLELPAEPGGGYGAQQTLPFTGLNEPAGIAVDSAGDVFVFNYNDGASQVVELPAGAASSSQQVTVPFTGLQGSGSTNLEQGLAVDSSGDVFVASTSAGQDFELSGYEASTTAVSSVTPAVPVTGQPLTVDVDVTPDPAAGGAVFSGAPAGQVTVSDGNGQSCTATLSDGTGSCQLTETTAGSYTLTASYAGQGAFTASSGTASATVDTAPAFVTSSPPLTATAGSAYGYTFTASGSPAPGYALASGAPSWLSINSSTGALSGTVPAGTTSFSYSVTASNPAGTATAGPFTVTVTKATPARADLSARLSCPASVQSGASGSCTLTVSNAGPSAASSAVAAIALAPALTHITCNPGCTALGNVVSWKLGSLAAGASVNQTVTFTAGNPGTALVLGVAASATLDPHPLNNLALATISIKR